MGRTGIVHSPKDRYWDLRPTPAFGTVEMRVWGTPLTVGWAAALAAYPHLSDQEQLPARAQIRFHSAIQRLSRMAAPCTLGALDT